MSIFKELLPEEISYREFYAYKEWVFTDSNDEIMIMAAVENTGSYFYPWSEPTQSTIYKRTLYDSIKHLYYYVDSRLDFAPENMYSQQMSGSTFMNKFYAPDHNFGPNTFDIHKNLGDQAVVISIPQSYIGDGIRPGSVKVESVTGGYELYDDKKGNLYDQVNSASFSASKASFTVGNVFYDQGNITLTSLSSSYQNFVSHSAIVSYESTQKIYEMEAYCTANAGEFNLTWNPTIRSGSSLLTPELKGVVTSSEFSTFPTSIGLYDDTGALVAIGKIAQPIRNYNDLAITFAVRIDW